MNHLIKQVDMEEIITFIVDIIHIDLLNIFCQDHFLR